MSKQVQARSIPRVARLGGAVARGRIAVAALGLAATCMLSPVALSQDKGATPPKDVIFARKILMNGIDGNMDEIETMLVPEGRLDLSEGHEHADTISIMLMTFPHLFPSSTNQWKPNVDRDPAIDTFASPDLWENFSDFYQKAAAASKIALEATKARNSNDFRTLIVQLRAACNGCHASYQKAD